MWRPQAIRLTHLRNPPSSSFLDQNVDFDGLFVARFSLSVFLNREYTISIRKMNAKYYESRRSSGNLLTNCSDDLTIAVRPLRVDEFAEAPVVWLDNGQRVSRRTADALERAIRQRDRNRLERRTK